MNTAAKLKTAMDHFGDVTQSKLMLASLAFLLKKCFPPTKCLSLDTLYNESQKGQMEQVYHTFFSPQCKHCELCHHDGVLLHDHLLMYTTLAQRWHIKVSYHSVANAFGSTMSHPQCKYIKFVLSITCTFIH